MFKFTSSERRRQNHDVKIDNEFFQNVAKFIHSGITLTKQNSPKVEIKGRSNLGSANLHGMNPVVSYNSNNTTIYTTTISTNKIDTNVSTFIY
jgi:hypothetical protein